MTKTTIITAVSGPITGPALGIMNSVAPYIAPFVGAFFTNSYIESEARQRAIKEGTEYIPKTNKYILFLSVFGAVIAYWISSILTNYGIGTGVAQSVSGLIGALSPGVLKLFGEPDKIKDLLFKALDKKIDKGVK